MTFKFTDDFDFESEDSMAILANDTIIYHGKIKKSVEANYIDNRRCHLISIWIFSSTNKCLNIYSCDNGVKISNGCNNVLLYLKKGDNNICEYNITEIDNVSD